MPRIYIEVSDEEYAQYMHALAAKEAADKIPRSNCTATEGRREDARLRFDFISKVLKHRAIEKGLSSLSRWTWGMRLRHKDALDALKEDSARRFMNTCENAFLCSIILTLIVAFVCLFSGTRTGLGFNFLLQLACLIPLRAMFLFIVNEVVPGGSSEFHKGSKKAFERLCNVVLCMLVGISPILLFTFRVSLAPTNCVVGVSEDKKAGKVIVHDFREQWFVSNPFATMKEMTLYQYQAGTPELQVERYLSGTASTATKIGGIETVISASVWSTRDATSAAELYLQKLSLDEAERRFRAEVTRLFGDAVTRVEKSADFKKAAQLAVEGDAFSAPAKAVCSMVATEFYAEMRKLKIPTFDLQPGDIVVYAGQGRLSQGSTAATTETTKSPT